MSDRGPARPTGVDFHFDIMCPYAYQTSLWIRNVREETGLDIRWRFFSLEEINRQEGKKHPWEREWSYGWSMMRVGALLRRQDMSCLLYTSGTSRQPRMCMRVDLPEPDGPMTATYSPASMVNVTPVSYTHLDVYKRQDSCGGVGRARWTHSLRRASMGGSLAARLAG